jgi:uncharacterized protein YlaI|tara:strand:- start:8120 stop:8350 length:231 start_codon:yes stop_codon:yes gene_type:complete
MELDQEFGLEHLLFVQRKCKICGEIKTLTDDFYKTRKDRGNTPGAYAYECKGCYIWRVKRNKKRKRKIVESDYPDW